MTVLTGLKAMLGLPRSGAASAERNAGAGPAFSALMATAQGAAAPKAADEPTSVAGGTVAALPSGEAVQPVAPEGQSVQSAAPSAPAASSEAALSVLAQDAPRPQRAVARAEGAVAAVPTDERPAPADPSPAQALDEGGNASPVHTEAKVHKPTHPAKIRREPDPSASDAPPAEIEADRKSEAQADGAEALDEDRTQAAQSSNAPTMVVPVSPSLITSPSSQPDAASGEGAPSVPAAIAARGHVSGPLLSLASPATADTARIDAKPLPPAEAAALLQMVRDHVKTGGTDAVEHGPSASVQSGESLPVAATPAAIVPSIPQVAQSVPAPMATVDLSASLGAQVEDIGVSGQWIDGLAREIAGLSAHGARGRFQIDAAQLGPIQVDIRQSADGAAVSLTVASDLAEQALRQDSDRLKLDAGLSAVRISEVRVERAPAAESARNDGAGPQSSPQGQGQSSGQAHAQAQAQSHPHGRGRARENIVLPHKGSGDAAVLNHEQGGATATDLPRARYA